MQDRDAGFPRAVSRPVRESMPPGETPAGSSYRETGAGWLKARCTHSLTRKHILEENRHRSHASAVTGALGPLVTASALLAFGLIPASRTSAQSVSPPPVTILQ